jgi:transcriptional regulator with XRE-family HTH domain
VRRLRQAGRLSLRALAAATGFSPSFISQLENGLVSPSIDSMEKIAAALGVSLGAFFATLGAPDGSTVVRARARRAMHSEWSAAEIEALSSLAGRLEPLLVTLHPGGRSGKHPVTRPTEAFALVLEGQVALRLGPDEHQLAAGDAVTLIAGEPRLWRNDSAADCRILIVAMRLPAGP